MLLLMSMQHALDDWWFLFFIIFFNVANYWKIEFITMKFLGPKIITVFY